METVVELFESARSRFPALSARADELHVRLFGEVAPSTAFSWFESLARALNEEMAKGVPARVHAPLFRFMSGSFVGSGPEVRECIDVAFVENLFWQVPSVRCRPYWQQLPEALRKPYRDFHRREP